MCIVAREEPPLIVGLVGLETRAEMNLVQIGTNEFFPNSPLLNSRKPSTTRKLHGFLFAMSTMRFRRDVWNCVPPCFKWTGIAQCSAGAAII